MKWRDLAVYGLWASFACMSISPIFAAPPEFSGGHIKYRFLLNSFPDDSLYRELVGSPALDQNADLRLKFNWSGEHVSLLADYQLAGLRGDGVVLANKTSGLLLSRDTIVNDDRRLFDLTHVISSEENSVLVHRLDRLSLDYTGSRAVVRLGRQAISWGNGLLYTPMDIFNPFDPSTIDKEYKSGDDMVYGQYLMDNGDDLQGVWVLRRDQQGEVSDEVDSVAAKFHGFSGRIEYDLLLADHYDDEVAGIGGLIDAGGAILRGDLVLTDTQSGMVTSLVTNLSYSWVSGGHNVSGILEYFYNGFGQPAGEYSPEDLASNPDLIERLARGELFTLGRHYIAASAVIEITPLWLLTPNIFVNVGDGSMLMQLVSSYDFQQDWMLLSALSIPVGPSGTEFGGIDSPVEGKTFGTGPSLFLQLAWYF